MKTYSGEIEIPAKRQIVWGFVTDPEKVGYCLPDVLSLDVIDPNHFHARVRVGMGPIRGAFQFSNSLTVEEEGSSATMSIKGGGMGSGVQMEARMELHDTEYQGTLMKWSTDVTVNGPIATIGGRLMDGQARKITAQVFDNIQKEIMKMTETQEDTTECAADEAADEIATTAAEEEKTESEKE